MPLFKNMPKKTATLEKPSTSSSDAAEPQQRPGTSGTELLLTTNRRTASANYQAAQRAENAYKAKKRSAGARQHRADAKVHFRQSAHHLKEGIKSVGSCFAAVPWMVKGWKEDRQSKKEKAARERDLKKKSKLEEKLAKQAEAEKGKENEEAAE